MGNISLAIFDFSSGVASDMRKMALNIGDKILE